VDDIIVWVAEYLIWVMCAGFALLWLLREHGSAKVLVLVAAVLGLGLTVVGIVVAGHLHTDPRPFAQPPYPTPLFSHAKDNGFPSDHSAAAGLIAALALLRRHWRSGVALAACAAGIAAARVAAHVHHVQDVVAGLLIGAAAATIAVAVVVIASAKLAARRPQAVPPRHRVESLPDRDAP
jgi:undecaprenyl-diphosphatase